MRELIKQAYANRSKRDLTIRRACRRWLSGRLLYIEGAGFGDQDVDYIDVVPLPSEIWIKLGIWPRRSNSRCGAPNGLQTSRCSRFLLRVYSW